MCEETALSRDGKLNSETKICENEKRIGGMKIIKINQEEEEEEEIISETHPPPQLVLQSSLTPDHLYLRTPSPLINLNQH